MALVMMCDSVEAATKSLDKPDNSKIDNFVETIIDKQIEEDQFVDCELTFKNISTIKSVLKEKLKNIYHVRIEYPEIVIKKILFIVALLLMKNYFCNRIL